MIITSSAKPILNIKREMTTSYSVPLQFCLIIISSQLFKSLNHLITYLVVPHFSQEGIFQDPQWISESAGSTELYIYYVFFSIPTYL